MQTPKVSKLAPTLPTTSLLRAAILVCLRKQSKLLWEQDVTREYWWANRSTASLMLIYKWLSQFFQLSKPLLWVPDYFCDDSLSLLKAMGAELVFYPITADLNPDWDACLKLSQEKSPHGFMLLHYFGLPLEIARAKKFCDKVGAILIEDCVHSPVPQEGIGQLGDITLFSPHKHFAIPDGAVVGIKKNLHKNKKPVMGQDPLKMFNDIVLAEKLSSHSNFIWMVKRSLQHWFPMARRAKLAKSSHCVAASMSKISSALLSVYTKKITRVLQQRQSNHAAMIATQDFIPAKFKRLTNSQNSLPYGFVIKCDNELESAKAMHWLAEHQYPVQTWSDLPTQVEQNPKMHGVAINLAKSILLVHVHASVNLANNLQKILKNMRKQPVSEAIIIRPSHANQLQWNQQLKLVDFSNLLQSWAYAEAKALTGGWKIERYEILRSSQIIGVLQLWKKSFGLVQVIRINRGPIFFSTTLSTLEKMQVFKAMRRKWNLLNGSMVLLSPEMEHCQTNSYWLKHAGFLFKLSSSLWTSAKINLRQELEDIYKNLHSKWRNALNLKDNELQLLNANDAASFQSFLQGYQEFIISKKFQGIPAEFLQAYYDCAHEHETPFVFMLKNANHEVLAAVLIAVHATTCTYLAGWSTVQGRTVNANNVLLWEAIKVMHQKGLAWFDVGGIDAVNTPTIAHFKRGMAGTEYQLQGELF